MMGTVWVLGSIIIFILGLAAMAWADGKGEVEYHDEWIFGIFLAAILWPVIVAIAAAVAPFLGFYRLIRRLSRGKQT